MKKETDSLIVMYVIIYFVLSIILIFLIKKITNYFISKRAVEARLILRTKTCIYKRVKSGRRTIMIKFPNYVLTFETNKNEKIGVNLDIKRGDQIPLNVWGKLSYHKRYLYKFECDKICITNF